MWKWGKHMVHTRIKISNCSSAYLSCKKILKKHLFSPLANQNTPLISQGVCQTYSIHNSFGRAILCFVSALDNLLYVVSKFSSESYNLETKVVWQMYSWNVKKNRREDIIVEKETFCWTKLKWNIYSTLSRKLQIIYFITGALAKASLYLMQWRFMYYNNTIVVHLLFV